MDFAGFAVMGAGLGSALAAVGAGHSHQGTGGTMDFR